MFECCQQMGDVSLLVKNTLYSHGRMTFSHFVGWTDVGVAGHWSVPALLLLAVTTVGLAAPLAPLGPPAGHVEDEVRPGHPGTSRGGEGTVCSSSVAGVAVRQVGLWDLVLSTQRPVQEAHGST